MAKSVDVLLTEIETALRTGLGENLFSCCVYGSTVRGNAIPGVSDVNILIVLNESTPAAHQIIGDVIASRPEIDPFVLARRGLERTARCFASKFANIQRNYRVLHGADPFATLRFDPALERLLCEQAVRNLRLRFTHVFVMRGRTRSFSRFLAENISAIFIHLAEIMRLNGHDVPKDFAARIPLMQSVWKEADPILAELLELRRHPRALRDDEIPGCHARVLALLDAALATVEQNWTEPTPPSK